VLDPQHAKVMAATQAFAAEWAFPDTIATAVRDHDSCALVADLPDFGDFRLDAEAPAYVLTVARDEVASLLARLESPPSSQSKLASSA
jgi:hypothetical protein